MTENKLNNRAKNQYVTTFKIRLGMVRIKVGSTLNGWDVDPSRFYSLRIC